MKRRNLSVPASRPRLFLPRLGKIQPFGEIKSRAQVGTRSTIDSAINHKPEKLRKEKEGPVQIFKNRVERAAVALSKR